MAGSGASPEIGPRVQDYSALARDYDERRYIGETNALKERFRRGALATLLPERAERALDIACGTGRGLDILRTVASTVFGVDGTLGMLEIARQKLRRLDPHVQLCQGNAGALPYASGTFDLVSCLNFVHLFPSPEHKVAFVTEMGRVLKPGGTAIVEFDNAFHGLVIGPVRKYLGKDIGYDWPWTIRRCFPPELFTITAAHGANLPWVWRIPLVRGVERAAGVFPINWMANRIFVKASRI